MSDHHSHGDHSHEHRSIQDIGFSIITISDTRTLETDKSGLLIESLIKDAGHIVKGRTIVKDEPAEIRNAVNEALADIDSSALILTGGTGITPRDNTPETIVPMLDKELEGFGEIFRTLSFEEIGSRAMLSRAIGGIIGQKAIFCIPGSTGAVKLAMEKLILPGIGHILWEARR